LTTAASPADLAAMTAPQAHYRELDGLRGLAAQAVLIAHANVLIMAQPSFVAGWIARLAVLVFFVLSGFAIATTIRRHDRLAGWDWFDYAIRRVARIYPPYLVAVASVAVITAFSLSGWTMLGMFRPATEFNTDALSWLRALFFLWTGNDGIAIIDIAIWSLRIEVALYVIAGLTAAIWFGRDARKIFLVPCLAIATAIFCWRLSFMAPAIVLFGCGAAAALTPIRNIPPRWGWAFVATALALPIAWPSLSDDPLMSSIYQALLGAPIAVGLMLLTRSGLVERTRWGRYVAASGSWSYTLYIMHSPILIGLRTLFADSDPTAGGTMRSAAMFAVYFLLTNVICWLIALAFERPSYFARVIRNCFESKRIERSIS
jgi:peptidoglycan/LPS O-acetylase OafA/YrhL